MKKKMFFLFLLALITLSIYLVSRDYHADTFAVLGYGTIEAREIRVGSKLGGRIAQVHVAEGDRVGSGHVLITLDSRELEAQEAEARASLSSARAKLKELSDGYRIETIEGARATVKEHSENLKKMKSGPRPEEIDAQESKMRASQVEYEHALKTYDRLVEKLKQGIVAEQEKDDVKRSLDMNREKWQAEKKNYELLKAGFRQEEIEMAAARLGQAGAELKRLEAGPRKEELDQAEAFVQEAQARLKRIGVQLEERNIVSPTEARVEVCDLEPGDILAPGQVAIELLKPHDIWVKIYIKEHELHRVKIEQKVEVSVEIKNQRDFRSWFLRRLFASMSEPKVTRHFEGKVVHIASQAEFTPRNVQTVEERGNQVFAVKVKIEDESGFLRPGMSVTVTQRP